MLEWAASSGICAFAQSLSLGSPGIFPGEEATWRLIQRLPVLWHGLGSPGPSCLRPASQVPDSPALPAELARTVRSQAVSLKALLLLAHHPKLRPLTDFWSPCKPYQQARICQGELVVEGCSHCALCCSRLFTLPLESLHLFHIWGPLALDTHSGLGSWGSAAERLPPLAWGGMGAT